MIAVVPNSGIIFVALRNSILSMSQLSSILEFHEEDHVCILGDFNATPASPRFNEICDMLHENSVVFRDTDFLPDNTYTHVNNGS